MSPDLILRKDSMKLMEVDLNCGKGTLHIFGKKIERNAVIKINPPNQREKDESNKLIQNYNYSIDASKPMKDQEMRIEFTEEKVPTCKVYPTSANKEELMKSELQNLNTRK